MSYKTAGASYLVGFFDAHQNESQKEDVKPNYSPMAILSKNHNAFL
jgi:hypothetical protein